jgi:hypothetical protein
MIIRIAASARGVAFEFLRWMMRPILVKRIPQQLWILLRNKAWRLVFASPFVCGLRACFRVLHRRTFPIFVSKNSDKMKLNFP